MKQCNYCNINEKQLKKHYGKKVYFKVIKGYIFCSECLKMYKIQDMLKEIKECWWTL